MTAREVGFVLVDNQQITAAGMEAALREFYPDCQCSYLRNVQEVISFGKTPLHHVDLCIIDMDLQGSVDGIAVGRRVQQQGWCKEQKQRPKMVLSGIALSEVHVREGLVAGCSGVFLKSGSAAELRSTVSHVRAGGQWIPKNLAPTNSLPGYRPQHRVLGLTDRQWEVLQLLPYGYSNREIADLLQIAEPTVRVHLSFGYKCLKVTSRAQAVVLVQKMIDESKIQRE